MLGLLKARFEFRRGGVADFADRRCWHEATWLLLVVLLGHAGVAAGRAKLRAGGIRPAGAEALVRRHLSREGVGTAHWTVESRVVRRALHSKQKK